MNETQEKNKGGFKDTDMQAVIGWILRIGVFVSMSVVVAGGILYLIRHGHSTPEFGSFHSVPHFISTPEGVFEGVLNGRGQAIIQLGIIILIITPVLRVAFAVVGFALEKDRLYTFISLLVLTIIVVSMLTGRIG